MMRFLNYLEIVAQLIYVTKIDNDTKNKKSTKKTHWNEKSNGK